MPLALDLALVGETVPEGQRPLIRHSNAASDLIGKINRAIVRGCNSCVYAHEDTPQLRGFMVKNHLGKDIMLAGRRFSNDGAPMTDEAIDRLMKRIESIRAKEREKEASAA